MKILVAEDDRSSRTLLTRTLERWGYQVIAVDDGERAWEEIVRAAPRMVISDWEMPRLDGPGLVRRIRQRGEPYLFTLLLTQHSDPDRIVEGLEAGADDFVSKPFVPAELRARLGVGRRLLTLQDELLERYREIERAKEQLSRIAATDPLMNIGNRRRFERVLEEVQARGEGWGFLMVDIDHFKSINDRHGHAMGDRVLAGVARALSAALGEEGEAFRYGGEEVAVVVRTPAAGRIAAIGERLRAAVAALAFDPGEGAPLRITASVGGAAAEGADWRTVVERGDSALYRAKAAGRDRVVLWEAEEAPLDGRQVAELLDALAPEELAALYRQFAARGRDLPALLARDPPPDGHELERRVHDLKGTAANLGLAALAGEADRVLTVVRQQGAAAALRESPPMVALLAQVSAWLESERLDRWLASLSAPAGPAAR